jgi:hypothetical protein
MQQAGNGDCVMQSLLCKPLPLTNACRNMVNNSSIRLTESLIHIGNDPKPRLRNASAISSRIAG